MSEKPNIVIDLTLDFAVRIIEFCEQLEAKKKFVITAQDPESKADFIHKFKISAKEGRETRYWLTLCKRSKTYPFDESLLTKLDLIQKVLNKIIATQSETLVNT